MDPITKKIGRFACITGANGNLWIDPSRVDAVAPGGIGMSTIISKGSAIGIQGSAQSIVEQIAQHEVTIDDILSGRLVGKVVKP